ncbi:MAG: hypothetical protein U1E25_15945 [Methylocystis sp.]
MLHIERAARGLGLIGPLTVREGRARRAFRRRRPLHHRLRIRRDRRPRKPCPARLSAIPGVVDHGLFIGLATAIFIAGAEGVRIGNISGDKP